VTKTNLPWETVGAFPEMLRTAWGSLFKSLRVGKGERLLIAAARRPLGWPRRQLPETMRQSLHRQPAGLTANNCCVPAARIRWSSMSARLRSR
jgi:hypothetical protein